MAELERMLLDPDLPVEADDVLVFAATERYCGKVIFVKAGEQLSRYSVEYPLMDLVNYSVSESGYEGDPDEGVTPMDELMADLEKLYGGIPEGSMWVSRMSGELTRAALDDDLDLGASPDQSYVNRYFEAQQAVGTPPACPPVQPCDPWDSTSPGDLGANPDDVWGGSGSCAMGTGTGTSAALGGLALAAALALSRRRRARG